MPGRNETSRTNIRTPRELSGLPDEAIAAPGEVALLLGNLSRHFGDGDSSPPAQTIFERQRALTTSSTALGMFDAGLSRARSRSAR